MMRAMLLAAGRGERMRPLTDDTAKPLLEVGGRALIERHIERLAAAGFRELVVNLSWHADRVRAALGDGARHSVSIAYSDEGPEPLETAGGIVRALPLLGAAPFVVVNADIWTDYDFARLALPGGTLAHLVLVPNPDHNPDGDFSLDRGSGAVHRVSPTPLAPTLTFSGISVYSPDLFTNLPDGKRPLAPLLHEAADAALVSGELYEGEWSDVGTPERLAALRARVQ